jgi:hypothetical protein
MHVHLSFRSDIYNLYNLTSIELITAFREEFLSGVLLAASPVLPTPTVAPGQIDVQGLCLIFSRNKTLKLIFHKYKRL